MNAEVTMKQNVVDMDVLIEVLSKKFDTEVIGASYTITQLGGGTLGNVRRLTGVAETKEEQVAYNLVLKIQSKWERFADPDSWRREYDLYMSELDGLFTEELRWPECYHAQLEDQKVRLWMEFIEGVSGLEMNVDMDERCVPAYYDGFSEYVDISDIADDLIREQMLFMFGYRLVEGFKFSEDQAKKELNLNTLQKIYEMVK